MTSGSPLVIRETTSDDLPAIAAIPRAAFGGGTEAELTAALLGDPTAQPVVSLLALYGTNPAGHILFTRCRLDPDDLSDKPRLYLLAPLAVVPEYRKLGIGSLLIARGLELLHRRGTELVFVLGHPEYYARHGFLPDAAGAGYPPPYPIPADRADCWMVRTLSERGLRGAGGRVVCADRLLHPEYWRE